MRKVNHTQSHCLFKTKRLRIERNIEFNKKKFAKEILNILTSKVTEYLPDSWQEVNSIGDSLKWICDRYDEGTFLTVRLLLSGELVGLIFLYEPETEEKYRELMFGYLISESNWGQGYGTELINGLVEWCKVSGTIKSLSGGVARKNVGSIRVLEKCGFVNLDEDTPIKETMMFKQEFRLNC